MAVFERGALTAALATALAVAPSLFGQENVAGKAAPNASATAISPDFEYTPTVTRQASDYSERHPEVAIVVAKGKKEGGLTGQEIGDTLARALLKKYAAPSKYFVRDSIGDYTNITFLIKGRSYGPYSLGESVIALALVSRDFDRAHGLPSQRGMDIAGKPAPGQD